MAEIKDGREQPASQWSGALEQYILQEQDDVTVLTVDVDAAEEYQATFQDTFPKALQRVKVLAEETV